MVDRVDELLVYQKALAAADEISALLKSEGFAKDHRLRRQVSAASERVASLIAEGFEQKTDRHSRLIGTCHEIPAVKREHNCASPGGEAI
jgi:23S rRNA-intervening sequence protein